MTAQILPFPGCNAIARAAIDKLKTIPDPRSGDKIVADYTSAVLRGIEKWAETKSDNRSVMDAISCSLIESGLVPRKAEDRS